MNRFLPAMVLMAIGCTERGDNQGIQLNVAGEGNTVIISTTEWPENNCTLEKVVYISDDGSHRQFYAALPVVPSTRWAVALNGSDSSGAGAADLVDSEMVWSGQKQYALRLSQELGLVVVCPDGGAVPSKEIQGAPHRQLNYDLEAVELARDVYGLQGDPLIIGHSWGANRALDLALDVDGDVYASGAQLESYDDTPPYLDRDYGFILCSLEDRLRLSYGTVESGEYVPFDEEWGTHCGASFHLHGDGHRVDLDDLVDWARRKGPK